ncbi:MAG: VOC family protein [Pseudomonadota bacterium]
MQLIVGYVTVYVSDFQRSLAFYRDTLGLPFLFADEGFGYARFQAGAIQLAMAAVPADAPNARDLVGRHMGIALSVADIDQAYDELLGRGVRFPLVPTVQPWGGKLAMLADPDGNEFHLDVVQSGPD